MDTDKLKIPILQNNHIINKNFLKENLSKCSLIDYLLEIKEEKSGHCYSIIQTKFI